MAPCYTIHVKYVYRLCCVLTVTYNNHVCTVFQRTQIIWFLLIIWNSITLHFWECIKPSFLFILSCRERAYYFQSKSLHVVFDLPWYWKFHETQPLIHDNLDTLSFVHDNLDTLSFAHDNLNTLSFAHDNLKTLPFVHDNLKYLPLFTVSTW